MTILLNTYLIVRKFGEKNLKKKNRRNEYNEENL